jgi:hypothetical protein
VDAAVRVTVPSPFHKYTTSTWNFWLVTRKWNKIRKKALLPERRRWCPTAAQASFFIMVGFQQRLTRSRLTVTSNTDLFKLLHYLSASTYSTPFTRRTSSGFATRDLKKIRCVYLGSWAKQTVYLVTGYHGHHQNQTKTDLNEAVQKTLPYATVLLHPKKQLAHRLPPELTSPPWNIRLLYAMITLELHCCWRAHMAPNSLTNWLSCPYFYW